MPRVIVAEDDPEMRRLVVEALRKDGHHVTEVSDGGRLLVQIAEAFDRDPTLSQVDVIVSDVRMPVCNGIELLERLADARWGVPVILMTAFGDEDTRKRAARIGAVLFDKPLSLEALRDAVNRLAARRPLPPSSP
ncbi:MAG TPA: response regulator [Polyangiaceae bacterium]|nr:response regulator [Polyangiaceae bacterium]